MPDIYPHMIEEIWNVILKSFHKQLEIGVGTHFIGIRKNVVYFCLEPLKLYFYILHVLVKMVFAGVTFF